MIYSLLVPTRERASGLERFMNSVWKTTTHKKNIEVLFGCDEDDNQADAVTKHIINQYRTIHMEVHKRKRSVYLNKDYYNWLAEKAHGDFYWILADDLEIMAYNWDEIILNHINAFLADKPDRIVCASIKDNTPPPSHLLPKFPCFPMFSKQVLEALGFLLHPRVPNWGADYVAYQTFKPIGRLLQIHDRNYLNHISWHTKQIKPDKTNVRIGNIFNELKMVPEHNVDRILAGEVPKHRGKLNKFIGEHNERMGKEKPI